MSKVQILTGPSLYQYLIYQGMGRYHFLSNRRSFDCLILHFYFIPFDRRRALFIYLRNSIPIEETDLKCIFIKKKEKEFNCGPYLLLQEIWVSMAPISKQCSIYCLYMVCSILADILNQDSVASQVRSQLENCCVNSGFTTYLPPPIFLISFYLFESSVVLLG